MEDAAAQDALATAQAIDRQRQLDEREANRNAALAEANASTPFHNPLQFLRNAAGDALSAVGYDWEAPTEGNPIRQILDKLAYPIDMEDPNVNPNAPTPYRPSEEVIATYSPERQRAIKKSRLRLEQATDEVEWLKPTTEKLLAATGLNLRESAAGSAKQAVGNVLRSYMDVVAPEKPIESGSLKYYLQFVLKNPVLNPAASLHAMGDISNPASLPNLLRETGKLTAGEGTAQLKEAQELTEQLGGGPLVSGAASLASTAGATLPSLLVGGAAGPYALSAMSVAGGLQTFGQSIDQFKDKLMELDPKLTEQQAFDKATLPAAIAGAASAVLTRAFGGTERIIQEIATKGLSKAATEGVLRSIFKSATLEVPEEWTQQFAQGLTEKAFVDPNKKIGDIWDDANMAALQAFTLGIGTGGTILGVARAGSKIAGKIKQTVQRSKVRRELGPEGNAAIRRVIETKGQPNGQGQMPESGELLARQGQPVITTTEDRPETGAEQRVSPDGEAKAGATAKTTTDVVQNAIEQVFPKPQPAPPPAAPKQALFAGYQFDNPNLPQLAIPGVRPGIVRHVSPATAQKLGYAVPDQLPTFEQWKQSGSSTEPVEQIAAAPAEAKPGTPQNPIDIQVQRADGTVVPAQFTGYYDYTSLGRGAIPSVGFILENGQVSHGMLSKGDKIIGQVPSFEEWSKAPVLPTTAQQQTGAPINWKEFAATNSHGSRVIDIPKLQQQLISGKVNGGKVSNQLLLYLLRQSDLHPLTGIDLYDRTPAQHVQDLGNPFQGDAPYRGLFYTLGGRTGRIEVLTKRNTGEAVSQGDFVQTLIHELVHNNITSKLRSAPQELQTEAHDLFNFVLQNSEGTAWTGKNALTNIEEFFSEAMSDPQFQNFLSGLDYGKTGKGKARKSVFSAFLDLLKRIFGMPDFITTATGEKISTITALEQAFSTASALEPLQRQAVMQAAAAPAEDANISQSQIQGGAAEVGRIADAIYSNREQGVQALEGLAYEKKQVKTAVSEIKRLNDLALAGYIQHGLDPENVAYPDATSGVGIDEDGMISADNSFTDALTVAGVPHTADNVQHLQEELYYERSASRYNKLKQQTDELTKAAHYYEALGVDPGEITKINQQLGELEEQMDKLGSAELNGRTVLDRAGEMTAAEGLRQERIAQRNSLSLEPVSDFFGRQVGAYREFSKKAQEALAMAQATRNAATDPEALRVATLAYNQWMNLPADIKNSILTGRPLTTEQKSVIFSALGQVFEEFDFAHQRMKEMVESKIPEINKAIRETLLKIANAKVQSGMGQVLLSDVLSTLDGETGATGNLKALAETQALRERTSAIESFAMALGKDVQTNQELFNWLANPSTPKPIIPPGITLGSDPATVQMILNEVQRNPAFGSSVLTLINSANKKLAAMPITGLQQIEEALKEGTPEGQNKAEAVARGLKAKARAQSSLGASNLRESLNQLDTLEIERRSLQEGQAMFAQMAATPEFRSTRDAVQNSPFGLVEPMVPQNHVATTFKAFGAPGLPSHPELVLDASRDTNFKADWFQKVAEWHKAAQEYLDAYDVSAALYHADPVNNPSPQSLGFDIPKVRGLRDATQRFVQGSFLELSLNSEGGRWRVPWLARALSRTALFRQHDFVSKMVGGVTGTDLKARLADFVNHYLIAQGIRDKYKDIPDKLHKALRAHPEFGMNIANYREFWNEMAHWGRMFGSPVKAGMVLPRSGRTVTEADIALLKRERAYEEALRRRVTETNVTQGIRVKVPGRELVRPGAYVGDEGLPRFPGRRADSFIADALAAYNIPPPAGSAPGVPPTIRAFGPATNLGNTSTDPVAAFWNRNVQHLIQHILDSRRTDRQMVLAPGMAQAEMDLAAKWITGGKPSISSLEDLVNELVAHHPPVPGLANPRDLVIQGLNKELRQYRDAAQKVTTDRAERDQARQSKPEIAFSAENEFTKPAAKLELPSALYDYGALSPGEHLTISSRANHERIVAYATAVNRAITELENRYNRYEDEEIDEKTAAHSYGGNIKEMQDVLSMLKKIQADFQNAYATGSFSTAPRGVINDTLGVLTSAILALPTVGLRNMSQGQFEVYAMSRAMGTAGYWLSAARALKAIPRTLIRFALHLGDGIVKRTNLGAALLTGKNHHLFEDFVHKFGNMIAGEDFRAVADKIGELGMDGRDSFLQRLQRIWQETSEFISREDMEKSWSIGGRKVKSTAAIPHKIIKAFFDKVGVQQYDFAINSATLNNAELLASRLKQVADVYGTARDGLGPFDPTNRAFDLKATEWGTGPDAQDTLAQMRQVLESSASAEGFQLEKALWEFYQKKKAGMPNPQMFTERQMDAVQRRILADMNASTPANRPSAASANSIIRNLLLLQGYPSDLLLKIINSGWGGIRDRGTLANAIIKTPAIAMLSLVAILIGYLVSSITGSYEKYVRGRMPSLATPLDKDFYTNWKRFAEGTLALGAAQFGYLGDIILSLMGEVRGNRGFDPTGRILGVSLVTRALTALRGAYNVSKAGGTVGDTLVPMWDVGRSMVPFWLEAQRVLGGAQGDIKQAERVRRGEAQTQGLLEGRSGFQPPTYGPTTVFRRNLGDAVSKLYEAQQAGDRQGAEAATADAKAQLAKLEEYHYQKYLAAGKDEATARQMAKRDTWNDYQDINPAVAAMLGKRPTQAQNELILQGITGDRRRIVDQGDNAWKAGAMALFGRQGTTTREESEAARAGGGGRGFNLPGVRSVRFPGLPGSRRRAEGFAEPAQVRGVRSRVRRTTEAPLRAVRAGTRSVQRYIGSQRNRRRRAFGAGPPKFRAPRVRSRRSRRRREYAVA